MGGQAAAYGGFAFVIVEAAVRFGLLASLIMEVIFVAGLAAAMQYRISHFGLEWSGAGFTFWALFLFFIALSVGLVAEETKRERRRSAALIRERTLLEERSPIARDLHDTVLKTLHGLALEAHVLRSRPGTRRGKQGAVHPDRLPAVHPGDQRDDPQLRTETQDAGIASEMSRMVAEWSKASGIKAEFATSGDDRILPLLASHHLRSVLSRPWRTSASMRGLPGHVPSRAASGGGASGDRRQRKGNRLLRGELYTLTAKGRFGISGMKERVEQLNGQFSIDAATGRDF